MKDVDRVLGVCRAHDSFSREEDKPLSVIKRNSMQTASSLKAGALIERSRTEYDCFNFFLACDIGVGLCEKDDMDESAARRQCTGSHKSRTP